MVTYKGQHCVIVGIVSAYKVEIHMRNGIHRVEHNTLRESNVGDIAKQKKLAREGRADNSELWQDGEMKPYGYQHTCLECDDAPCHLLRDVHKAIREVSIYEPDDQEADAITVYMRCLEAVGIDTAKEAEHVRQVMRDAIARSRHASRENRGKVNGRTKRPSMP